MMFVKYDGHAKLIREQIYDISINDNCKLTTTKPTNESKAYGALQSTAVQLSLQRHPDRHVINNELTFEQ